MKIGLHGGDCCGVKHIYELGYFPNSTLCARKAIKMTSYGQKYTSGVNDMLHKNPRGKYDFFNKAAPSETASKRMDRFITFIKQNRGTGVIEVILNTVTQKSWVPVLKEKGFKLVSKAKNGNTCREIEIYHLIH